MNPLLPLAAALAMTLSAAAQAHEDEHAAHGGAHDAMPAKDTPFGREGKSARADRTIQVEMSDAMRFTPSRITVRRGETVRFVAVNKGQVLHEMVLGTPEGLKAHAEMMQMHPGMAHEAPNMTHVKPGTSGQIVWQFSQPGEFQFACLLPGHFEAGMVGQVVVK